MPVIPAVIDGLTGQRMGSSGVQLHYGLTAVFPTKPTTFSPLAGVVKISGVDLKRQGPIDATELSPDMFQDTAGVFPADTESGLSDQNRTAETYFNTLMIAGIKDAQPMTISIFTIRLSMNWLKYWFDNDMSLYWKIVFRKQAAAASNAYFGGWAQINELPISIEQNKLVSAELQLLPNGRWIYFPGDAAGNTPVPNTGA